MTLYKLRILNNLKAFKTGSYCYYQSLIYDIRNVLYLYVKNMLLQFSNKVNYNNIYFLLDFIFFQSSDLCNFYELNRCHDETLVMSVLLCGKTRSGKFFDILYSIGEIPKMFVNKEIIINGLWKTFSNKVISAKKGAFFNYYLKDNTQTFSCRYIIDKCSEINYVLENNKFYIILKNYFKVDFFSFLLHFGVDLRNILKYSRYFNSIIFKKYFIDFDLDFSLNKKRGRSIWFSFLKVISSFFINDIISIKESIDLCNSISSFIIDLIDIYDFLNDIKHNKVNFIDIDFIGFKSILTLKDYLIDHFKDFFDKNASLIKREISSSLSFIDNVEEEEKLLEEEPIIIKSKNYFSAKEFLSVNPLVQYLDQTNSLSEIHHKNKVVMYDSNLNYNINVRNVKLTNLGFICPMDTTEGSSCGLTLSLAKNVGIDSNNKLSIPILSISDIKTNKFFRFINSNELEKYYIDFSNNIPRKNKYFILNSLQLHKNSFKVNYIELNKTYNLLYNDVLAFPETLIPFLYYNDPTRILMGSKMQTQSVPLYKSDKYFIYTNKEQNISSFNSFVLKADQESIVLNVSNNKIILRDIYNRKHIYYLTKYKKNNYSIITQSPIVWPGERIFSGQILTSLKDIIDSEFNIGNNLVISYGNFFGYNFEDSIVVNERVVYTNLFSSFDLNVVESTFIKNNKYDSFQLPSNSLYGYDIYSRRNLDNYGFVKEGAKLLEGDTILSKITVFPTFINKEKVYLHLFFGGIFSIIQDNSIKVNLGDSGRVVKVETFTIKDKDNPLDYLKARVYIANCKILSVGDKLCGFYGNKGVISYIMSNKDIMYTSYGISPDLITDSIGVPSRMNLGQLFEGLFGVVCKYNSIRIFLNNTNELSYDYIKNIIYQYYNKLVYLTNRKNINVIYSPGKVKIRDGLSGYMIKEPSFIGVSRYFKLIHMVDDKIHYRSVGPYTELIQQPLKGRGNEGGQRFGEMEIWSLEAYGSSYTIREMLSYKSDDIKARESLLNQYKTIDNLLDEYQKEFFLGAQEDIVEEEDDEEDIEEEKKEEENISEITISESFNILIRELNNLSLNLECIVSVKDDLKEKIKINNIYYIK